MKDTNQYVKRRRPYLWPSALCLAGIAAVLLGFRGVRGYCRSTFISTNPYCSGELEYLFVALCLIGLVIAPTSLIVLTWRLLRVRR